MNRINLLPNWQLPDSIPSVYDTQSGSFQEMVAKVYGAMKDLQLDYNKFAEEINKTITEFINSTNQDQEQFKECINKIMHDYIIKIDEKIKMQDLTIDVGINYMKDNIKVTTTDVLNEFLANGDIEVSAIYDDENEKLSLVFGGGSNE